MHMDPPEPGSWRLSRRTFVQGSLCSLALLALPCPTLAEPSPGNQARFYQSPTRPILPGLARITRSSACCAPRLARSWTATGATAACGKTGTANTTPWCTATPARCTWTRWRKSPFFTCCPGSSSFSIATAGCNLHCKFCQNWEISQARPEETYNFDLPPEKVVAGAQEQRLPPPSPTPTWSP